MTSNLTTVYHDRAMREHLSERIERLEGEADAAWSAYRVACDDLDSWRIFQPGLVTAQDAYVAILRGEWQEIEAQLAPLYTMRRALDRQAAAARRNS